MPLTDAQRSWIEHLEEEDLAFIKRFVLASGSLKEMASVYGVSYPTVRGRLDRLIERIRIAESKRITSEFERALRTQFAAGRIDMATLRRLRAAHKKDLEKTHENTSDDR